MPTTSATAIVEYALLVHSDGSGDAIPVGSPAWYAWLARATAFAFRSTDGTFTAHKERRGPTQAYRSYGAYWTPEGHGCDGLVA
jgi:hypothetical protein